MSYANGIVSAPVSVEDIRDALGTDECSVANLCQSNLINMWARYKPLRRIKNESYQNREGFPQLISYSYRESYHEIEGELFKHGIIIPYSENYLLNGMAHAIMMADWDEEVGWVYARPRGDRTGRTGGIKEYSALADFAPNSINDDDDPNYVQGSQTWMNGVGYNHNAEPFINAVLDMGGVREMEDEDGGYYEINQQDAGSIKFTFVRPTQPQSIQMEELIDDYDEDNITWRPLLQMFDEGLGEYGYEHWYERERALREAAGGKIMAAGGNAVSVEMPINDMQVAAGNSYYVVIGIGCCDADVSRFYNPTISRQRRTPCFIHPITEEQRLNRIYPFLYRFKIVNYYSGHINVTSMEIGGQQVQSDYPNHFTVPSSASGTLLFTMEIERNMFNNLHFIFEKDGEGWEVDEGYKSLSIQVIQMTTGLAEIVEYLAVNDRHCHIPQATEHGQTVTIQNVFTTYSGNYGQTFIDIGNVPQSDYGSSIAYRLLISVDGSTYVDGGSFSIRKLPRNSN